MEHVEQQRSRRQFLKGGAAALVAAAAGGPQECHRSERCRRWSFESNHPRG